MSALLRSSRSRSKTAPDTAISAASNKGQSVKASSGSPPGSPIAPQKLALKGSSTPEPTQVAHPPSETVLDIVPSDTVPIDIDLVNGVTSGPKELLDEQSDSRSSSLSELGDGSVDAEEPQSRSHEIIGREDNDSEAETERLENTPAGIGRRTGNNAPLPDTTPVPSPTKRGIPSASEDDPSIADSPADMSDDQVENADTDDRPQPTSDHNSTENVGKVADVAGRKRKRSSSDTSSTVEQEDEGPAKKKIESSRSDIEEDGDKITDANTEGVNEDINEETIEDATLEQADEINEDADAAGDAPEEAAEESTVQIRSSKSKKGKRKGKKVVDNVDKSNVARGSPDVNEAEEPVDGEGDEEDNAYVEEQNANKKIAMEKLTFIEQKFKIFRERLCDEKMAECSKSLEMLQQTNVVHPDFLKMIDCLDERRDEKIALERKAFQYKMGCLRNKILAERHQLQSQYLQTIRERRETILDDCNKRLCQLNKERRKLGADELEYNLYFPAKASEQRRHLSAYNLEVSVLAGVAKYVGFPAAPEIASARDSDIEEDLRAMKINTKPPAINRTIAEPTRADRVAAEERFLEQTPWANPQHPANNNFHPLAAAQGQAAPNSFTTPVPQRRTVDAHVTNGSVSTIEKTNDTPSSALGPGATVLEQQRRPDLESPVAQLKRAPAHTDSVKEPGAIPNNIRPGPSFAKEARTENAFAGLSAVPTRQQDPLQESTPADHGRSQLSQRSAVSVGGGGGAGAGMYGR